LSYPPTAILSDLHGNQPALERALEDARARGARRYVCLGDVVGYGARPRHNLDLVMRLCVPEPSPAPGTNGGPLEPGFCLLGNHEQALLHDRVEDFNPKARAAIEWTREELNSSEANRETTYAYWDFLAELEPKAVDERAMFVHGSPRDPVREYLVPRDIQDAEKMRANFALLERPVCFVGHSHVPAIYYEDGRLLLPKGTAGPVAFEEGERVIVNVGSIGQPRDGDNRLSYVLFDGDSVTFVRLEYDIESAASAIRAVDRLPDYLADRLEVGR